jgi:type I restriction enzyme S subunit
MSVSTPLAVETSIFGDSPASWHVDRIRDRLHGIVGGEWGDDPEAHDEGVEIPVIRVADIRGLDVATEDLTIRRVKESKLPGRLIGKRTLLLEKSGGGEQKPVGRAVLGRNLTFDAICSNFMAKTDCGPTINSLFVAYLLDAAYSSGVNSAHIQQTTGIQNLRVSDYLNTHVAIPPLPEQQRIAGYLDASCAAIDAAVAAKRRQLETLDAVRESLIESAVTQGVGPHAPMRPVNEEWITELPAHWEVCRIKRIVSRVDYGISESTEPEGRYPVLKMGHIQRGEIEFRDLDFVDEVSDDLLLETGDLLYNRTNSPDQVGKAAIFRRHKTDEITFASYLVRLRTNHRADPYFLNYLVNSRGFLSFARKLAIPSVQQSNLNSTRYCRMLIPCPPIKEQREIAAYLDRKVGELGRVVEGIEQQIATLTAYRKSLIHECVTGQRRITEADVTAAQRVEPSLSKLRQI